jgi:nucleotide-binding universal stress UspA family protein
VIFGTTASHVAQAAKQPVLIAQTDHRVPYRKLLVAIDESSAEEILHLALGIASATDLFVVHAQDSAAQSLFGGELLEDIRADQEVLTRGVADTVKMLGRSTAVPRIHNIVDEGDAVDVIMKAWSEVKPDLLVMGTHGREGLARLLRGSHAEAAIFGCPSDILVARIR